MSVSGFEGFEKRLELHFSGDDPIRNIGMGLRLLEFESLDKVLHAVQCTVVSAVGNHYFDAYVLSESSLFVYPTKIIIKTCGTTQLLKSIRPLLSYANRMGFYPDGCKYTRGSFIFPHSQPFPHTSFKEEVLYIESSLPTSLAYRKASIMPSKISTSHSWHVFTASNHDIHHQCHDPLPSLRYSPLSSSASYTIEICMTELDEAVAQKFFRQPEDGKSGHSAGREMTKMTGIQAINQNAVICDFAFDPCGYSMNGMDDDKYSTIHVTPEEGYSYASFECVVSMNDDRDDDDVVELLKKAVQVFRPGTLSLAISCTGGFHHDVWPRIVSGVKPLGLKCMSCTMDDFPAAGTVLFQTFSSRRNRAGWPGGQEGGR
ncbi:hypothetical protein Nepgr_030300 [Nepenthes gracilis]|uniref:S-adenosylmethionine decarboxylase proenzyme n=1 Tax=Nepenthes gracilis TaxID=150966 RepID=A0AAD3TGR1_NEPGR|nr:hypothetical protein Nepgr_030300 [Nepenthes gracilis]